MSLHLYGSSLVRAGKRYDSAGLAVSYQHGTLAIVTGTATELSVLTLLGFVGVHRVLPIDSIELVPNGIHIMSQQKEYHPVEMEEGAVVAQEVPAATVKATALPMIEVVAPATLPEGYNFEAEVGGRVFTVTVVSCPY